MEMKNAMWKVKKLSTSFFVIYFACKLILRDNVGHDLNLGNDLTNKSIAKYGLHGDADANTPVVVKYSTYVRCS